MRRMVDEVREAQLCNGQIPLTRRVAEWSPNPGTPSLDKQGLACAIYALALSCQVGGRESSHTRSYLKPITMTKHRPARLDAALSQILGRQFLQRVAPWKRRITGFNDASWMF